MSLHGDLEEVKKLWPSLSLPTKILLGSSLVVSILSVTSLADRVFELKGFISDAAHLYQELLSPAFIFLVSKVGLTLSPIKADALLLFLLISGALIRAQFLYNRDIVVIDVFSCIFLVWFTYSISDHAVFGVIYGYFGLICFMSALPLAVKTMRDSKALLSYRLAFATIVGMGLLVGVIAAISEGLARV